MRTPIEIDWGTSLALDSENRPHISYCDLGNGHIGYAWWTNSVWDIQQVDTARGVCRHSLKLYAAGQPHISYTGAYCNGYPCGDLRYARLEGNSWNVQAVDHSNLGWSWPSLALDTQGMPHIVYYDYANRDLKYAVGQTTTRHVYLPLVLRETQ